MFFCSCSCSFFVAVVVFVVVNVVVFVAFVIVVVFVVVYFKYSGTFVRYPAAIPPTSSTRRRLYSTC